MYPIVEVSDFLTTRFLLYLSSACSGSILGKTTAGEQNVRRPFS